MTDVAAEVDAAASGADLCCTHFSQLVAQRALGAGCGRSEERPLVEISGGFIHERALRGAWATQM